MSQEKSKTMPVQFFGGILGFVQLENVVNLVWNHLPLANLQDRILSCLLDSVLLFCT